MDTHADTHWAAVITTAGRHVADKQFPTTPDEYARLAGLITGYGRMARVGVEGNELITVANNWRIKSGDASPRTWPNKRAGSAIDHAVIVMVPFESV